MKFNNMLSKKSAFQRFTFTAVRATVCALAIVALASCTKPKKVDGDGGVEGSESSAASPVLADKEIGFDPQGSDSGKINGLSTVFFEYDSSKLSETARKVLKSNADWIKSNAKANVQIEGHTDSRGSTEYNLSLGERRAKAVRQYLESLGVDSKRMSIISYGEEKPLVPGDTESAYSKNRRANFVPLQ